MIFLTGATGFIGSHIVDRLLEDDSIQIIAIVRGISNYKNAHELKKKGVILIEGLFYDEAILKSVFAKYNIRKVLHFAALRGSSSQPDEQYQIVNVEGTRILLEFSLKNNIETFIFCSSVGVYGTIPLVCPATIQTRLNADGVYHESKKSAEDLVSGYVKKGLNTIIVRPTITYGPEESSFPNTLIELVRRKLLLIPRKNIKIHLLDVDGFSQLVVKLLGAEKVGQRTFLVADQEAISMKEIADVIHNHYHGRDYPKYLEVPEILFRALLLLAEFLNSDVWRVRLLLISKSWFFSIDETVKHLNYNPSITKESFLKRMQK